MNNMKKTFLFLFICFVCSCKNDTNTGEKQVRIWEPYNDSAEVAANADHEKGRMQYKLIQSKVLDKNDVFLPLYDEVSKMTEKEYEFLKPHLEYRDCTEQGCS